MENDNKNIIGCMNRIAKIGEGSYGVVYSATFKDDENSKTYAVKRNFKELSATWFGNIHEADVLVRLKGHPFIVELHKIAIGDPFDNSNAMTPTTADKRKMAEDKMHFILEYVSTCGDTYLQSKNFSYPNSKIILSQILVALEYMHNKNIIHRDLKPANILMDFNNNIPYSKICDFGMSCNYTNYEVKTPGVVTCWYRAPEICFGHKDYDHKSDIWSFGCLMFEFFSKEPWLVGVPDDDAKIINTILAKLEVEADKEDLEYLENPEKATKRIRYHTKDFMKRRLTFESQLNMKPDQKRHFEKYCGKLDIFLDALRKCLQINPQKRISIQELIRHPFFDYYRNYMDSVRNVHNNYSINHQVVINDSFERRWVINLAIDIYRDKKNDTENFTYPWYNHNIIFHAINLFERYLDWALDENNHKVDRYDSETENRGKLYNKQEIELRFWVCMYVMHKYYSTLIHPKKWEKFCPKRIRAGNDTIAEDFEYRLIKYACNYRIFQETLYEMIDKKESLNEEKVENILTFYSGIKNYIGGLDGLYALYRKNK